MVKVGGEGMGGGGKDERRRLPFLPRLAGKGYHPQETEDPDHLSLILGPPHPPDQQKAAGQRQRPPPLAAGVQTLPIRPRLTVWRRRPAWLAPVARSPRRELLPRGWGGGPLAWASPWFGAWGAGSRALRPAQALTAESGGVSTAGRGGLAHVGRFGFLRSRSQVRAPEPPPPPPAAWTQPCRSCLIS